MLKNQPKFENVIINIDDAIKKILESVLNINLQESDWTQARLN